MNNSNDNSLEQLSDSLFRLSNALESIDQGRTRLQKIPRWGTLVLVFLLGALVSAGFYATGSAFAQLGSGGPHTVSESKSVIEALDRINKSLSVLQMMDQMMQMGMASAMEEAMAPPKNDPQCKKEDTRLLHNLYCYAQQYVSLKAAEMGLAPDQLTREQRRALVQGAVMTAAGSVMADMGVLMHRIRQDSDFFRKGGLQSIQQELARLNRLMDAIPVMAIEMGAMNRQMSVMSHGVGSTMGRMGNWMPW